MSVMKDGFGLKRKDWKADPRIRLLGLAARGLYADLAAWAMDSGKRGYLVRNGSALGWVDLARLVNATVEQVRDGIAELKSSGLIEMAWDGTFFLPVIVMASAKSEKMRINALAGVQANLFEKQEETEFAEQKPDHAVVSIASAPEKRARQKKNPPHPLKENNNIYIYNQKIPRNAEDNPPWVELSVIKLKKLEYKALLAQLPLSDDALMDLLIKQDGWLERNPGYQQHWLAATLRYLQLVTGQKGQVVA